MHLTGIIRYYLFLVNCSTILWQTRGSLAFIGLPTTPYKSFKGDVSNYTILVCFPVIFQPLHILYMPTNASWTQIQIWFKALWGVNSICIIIASKRNSDVTRTRNLIIKFDFVHTDINISRSVSDIMMSKSLFWWYHMGRYQNCYQMNRLTA